VEEEDSVIVGEIWGETLTSRSTCNKVGICLIMPICCLEALNSFSDYASLLPSSTS
jgi:hypothetical protein